MSHRGPDGAGFFEGPGFALGHRRLAVVDLSPQAAQPMLSSDGRFSIVYNGELYNDAEVREELSRLGVQFRTRSDTETVLAALSMWGEEAFARLRGMYALCFVDSQRRVAILARDPLGVKPLYFAELGGTGSRPAELIFASEMPALRQHPLLSNTPDPITIASYMSTTRTTIGERTLLRDVNLLTPGTVLRVNFAGEHITTARTSLWNIAKHDAKSDASQTQDVVRESIRRHLRSDVPLCSLLSGGLDSSIVALVTHEITSKTDGAPTLRTYASGAKGASAPGGDDFAFARMMAERLGTTHTEAPVSQSLFEQRWVEMVARQGVPLSTPNEVAINEVARVLRGEGCVVALSGEGADELFGGYDFALIAALQYRRGTHPLVIGRENLHPGEFELLVNAWLLLDTYDRVFQPQFLQQIGGGESVRRWFREEFDRAEDGVPPGCSEDVLAGHLAFQRRINLSQLLLRLDTATMLESVEGRTPFADFTLARFAEAMPVVDRFIEAETRRPENTKIALRNAFGPQLPREIVMREKASFPLPFANWIGSMRRVILESENLAEIFTPEAIHSAAANASQYWNVAWPMMNLALWFKSMESDELLDAERFARSMAS